MVPCCLWHLHKREGLMFCKAIDYFMFGISFKENSNVSMSLAEDNIFLHLNFYI